MAKKTDKVTPVSEQVRVQRKLRADALLNRERILQVAKEAFTTSGTDVSMDEMLDSIREAIAGNGKLPCTLVVLDEVQQFIVCFRQACIVEDSWFIS